MCGVGTFNDKMKQQIYEAGKLAAKEKMPLIRERLNNLSMERKETSSKRLVQLVCYTPQLFEEEVEEEMLASREEND
jgi:NTE family protein